MLPINSNVNTQLDNSDAAIILRAIVKETNIVISETKGRGKVSLMHIPYQVSVNPPLDLENEENGQDAPVEAETIQSQVIIEVILDETRYDIPLALRSVRPYHFPSGQEGDISESYLTWTCKTISAGGMKLERDLTKEEKEKSIREEWELAQEGRAIRAKSKRDRYIYLKNCAMTDKTTSTENSGEVEAADDAEKEEGEESSLIGPPDGMGGMDEEEKRIETERRAKLEALPPIVLRGHLQLPKSDGKKANMKPRFVKRPKKKFSEMISIAEEKRQEGLAIRSNFLTDMIVEQGRRRLTADRQLHLLRKNREKKMKRIRELLDKRHNLIVPNTEQTTDEI